MNNKNIQRLFDIGILPKIKINNENVKDLFEAGIDSIDIPIEDIDENIKIKNLLICVSNIRTIDEAIKAINYGASILIIKGVIKEIIEICKLKSIDVIPEINEVYEIEKALAYDIKVFKTNRILEIERKDIFFIINTTKENLVENLLKSNIEVASIKINEDDVYTESKNILKSMLGYELIHVGINTESKEDALKVASLFCELFDFKLYNKPKSFFASRGFEIMHKKGYGEKGHIGIYTNFPSKAIYQLGKKGIKVLKETITRNKVTNRINLAYLDLEIAGFALHLINPDVKM